MVGLRSIGLVFAAFFYPPSAAVLSTQRFKPCSRCLVIRCKIFSWFEENVGLYSQECNCSLLIILCWCCSNVFFHACISSDGRNVAKIPCIYLMVKWKRINHEILAMSIRLSQCTTSLTLGKKLEKKIEVQQ